MTSPSESIWLSIVTVTKNDLAGLRRTISSLQAQREGGVEHIIVDGASTDGTTVWCQEHPQYPRTSFISEPDSGIYDAMNKGLRRAAGEIVCFLNSGDTFADSDVLTYVHREWRATAWQWAYGGAGEVDECGRAVAQATAPSRFRPLIQTFWHYDIPHAAVFMRASFLRDLNGFDTRFRIASDYRTILLAATASAPAVWPRQIASLLYGGISQKETSRAHQEAHQIRSEILSMGVLLRGLDLVLTHLLIVRARIGRIRRRWRNPLSIEP